MTSRFKRKQHIDIAQPYNITYVLNTCLHSLQKQHLGYPLIICKLEMQTVLIWALVVLNLVPSLSSLSCFHQRSTKAVRGRASAYSRWPYQHQLIKYMSGESFFMQFSNSKHEMYLLWWDWLQESRLQWQRCSKFFSKWDAETRIGINMDNIDGPSVSESDVLR